MVLKKRSLSTDYLHKCRHENRQHIYTAVTRAKTRLIMVASYGDLLLEAMEREPPPRNTSLKDKVILELQREREQLGIAATLGATPIRGALSFTDPLQFHF